jgi:hypothetical protein
MICRDLRGSGSEACEDRGGRAKESEAMKRITAVLTITTAMVLATALPAVAAYAPPAPVPGGTHGGAGTAFTGSELTIGVLLLGVLVVAGLAAILIGRRVTARH